MTIDYASMKRTIYEHHGVCVTYQGTQVGTKSVIALMNYGPQSEPVGYETLSTENKPTARVIRSDVDEPRRGDVIYNERNEAFTVVDYRPYGRKSLEWEIELTEDGNG